MENQRSPQRSVSRTVLVASLSLICAMAVVLASQFGPANAQSTPVSTDVPATITVSGFGSVSVDPDTATVSLGVYSREKLLKKAQDDVSQRLTDITAVLTDNDIAAEDIKTSSYSINPIPRYDDDGMYVGIDGYEITANLDITVRNIDLVGGILDASVEAGANQVGGVSFYVGDPSGPASQARTAAVNDARAKADELAAAAGVTIVGVQSIQETQAPEPAPVQYSQAAAADSDAAREVPISAGQSELRVDVQVVFIIESAAQ